MDERDWTIALMYVGEDLSVRIPIKESFDEKKGLTMRKVAEALEISVSTVCITLHSIPIEWLRKRIELHLEYNITRRGVH